MPDQKDGPPEYEARPSTPEDQKWRAASDFVAGLLMAIAAVVAGFASRPLSTDWYDFAAPTSQWATKESTLCQVAWFMSVVGVLVFPAAVHFFRCGVYWWHWCDTDNQDGTYAALGEASGRRSELKWAEYAISATIGTVAVYLLSRRRALMDPGETAPETPWFVFEVVLLSLSGVGLQYIGWLLDGAMNMDEYTKSSQQYTDDKKPHRTGLFFVGMGIFASQLLNSVAPYDKVLRLVYLMGYVPFAILMCVSMILHDQMTAPHQTLNKGNYIEMVKGNYIEMVNYLEVGYNICSCAAKIPLALIICFGKGDTDTDNLWVVGVVCLQIAMLLWATRCVYLGWCVPNAGRQGSFRTAMASLKQTVESRFGRRARPGNNKADFNL